MSKNLESDTEIKLFTYNLKDSNFIVLSNGCRVKAINGIQTLPIKEHFGIDGWAKWLKLKDVLTAEQLEELWLTYTSDPDFVLTKENLSLFLF